MTKPRRRFGASPLVLAALVALALPARAATALADPTRPPGWGAAPAAAPARAPAPPPAPPRVQSVQVPRFGAASALVNGRLLVVGDRLGSATVVAIDLQGLQLRDGRGRIERLSLYGRAAAARKDGVSPGDPAPAPVATLAKGQQP